MPKTLYGYERSPLLRAVLVTARAVGVKLEVQPLDFEKSEHKTDSFLKMNPAHTIPTLDDDGFYVWESRPIMGYLVSKYGKDDNLYPKDVNERATVDTILHFDNGSLWVSVLKLIVPILRGESQNTENEEAIKEKLLILERILSDRPYLAGDHVTIADISVVNTVVILPILGISLEPYTNLNTLIAKVKTDLPFFDEVNQKGYNELKEFIESKQNK